MAEPKRDEVEQEQKLDLRSVFGTNKKKEEEGVWFPIPDTKGELLIARSGNDAFEKLYIKLMKPHRRLLRLGKLSLKTQKDVTRTVTAHTILIGWRDVVLDKKPLPAYSPEEAERLFVEMPDFLDYVVACSAEVSQYQDEEAEERRGNLSSASSGT